MNTMTRIKTSQGTFAINEQADSKMSQHLSGNSYPQQDVLNFVHKIRAKKVVDVGAHIGTVSIPLARAGLHVIAFEPNRDSFELLTTNTSLNQVQIDARQKGLARMSGRATSTQIRSGNAGSNTLVSGEEIEISTLDAEVAQTDFIKIDVEGMELEVLEGGRELIAQSRPAIFFEVNLTALRLHGIHPSSLQRFFRSMQYAFYYWNKGMLYRVPSLPLITALISPRSYFFGGNSAVFDIVALSGDRVLSIPQYSYIHTLLHLIWRYVKINYARLFN